MAASPPHSYPDSEDTCSLAASSVLEDGSALWQRSTKCFICSRKFAALGLHRHHCRFCGISVCDIHSSKRRPNPTGLGLVRVCDACDTAIVGHEVQEEYRMKLFELKERLRMTRSRLERRVIETEEIAGRMQELDQEKQCISTQYSTRERDLEGRVNGEERVGKTYIKVLSSLQQAASQSSSAESLSSSAIAEKTAELTALQEEVQFLRGEVTEGNKRAETLYSQASGRVDKLKLGEMLCEACHRLVAVKSFMSDRETSVMTASIYQQSSASVPVRKACRTDCTLF